MEAPARLENFMPTAIPTNPAELRRILTTIQLQIIYDIGIELDRLLLPLRNIKITFDELDPNQDLSIKGEESLKDT